MNEIGRLRKMFNEFLADVWARSPGVFIWSLIVLGVVYWLIGLIVYTATNGYAVELPIGAYFVLWPLILALNLVVIIVDLGVQTVFLVVTVFKRGKK
jgi:hypothetical protein